jgi:hypothetical protein
MKQKNVHDMFLFNLCYNILIGPHCHKTNYLKQIKVGLPLQLIGLDIQEMQMLGSI